MSANESNSDGSPTDAQLTNEPLTTAPPIPVVPATDSSATGPKIQSLVPPSRVEPTTPGLPVPEGSAQLINPPLISPPPIPPPLVQTPAPPTSNSYALMPASAAAGYPAFSTERSNTDKQFRKFAIGGVIVWLAGIIIVGVLAMNAANSPPSWDPVLEPYVTFVEEERGFEFNRPVNVRWGNIAQELSDDDASFPVKVPEVDPYMEAYSLLGLVDLNLDQTIGELAAETSTENAGAFYTPWSETIVLPEGVSTDLLGMTIVHELVHALQHQNGMFDYQAYTVDDVEARRALIEGDAERIATAWFNAQSEAEQERIDQARPDFEVADPGNSYFEVSFAAAYAIGEPMVDAIVASEGNEGLNRLMLSKDAGTTQRMIDVFGPSTRSQFDAQELLTMPDGAIGTFPDGDLGPLAWFQTLVPLVGASDTFDALIGYDDDAFAVYENGDTLCARFEIFFSNRGEAAEFDQTASDAGLPTELVGSFDVGKVRMDVCEPIGDAKNQLYGTITPLVVVHHLAGLHIEEGASVEIARCASIAQAKLLSTGPLTDSLEWDAIADAAPKFALDCS